MRRNFLMAVLFVSFAVSAAEPSIDRDTLPWDRYNTMAKALEFPEDLPHIVVFRPDGKCSLHEALDVTWKAHVLTSLKESGEPACQMMRTDGPGSISAKAADHWSVDLYTLDLAFCAACLHAVSQLEQFARESDAGWRIRIVSIKLETD